MSLRFLFRSLAPTLICSFLRAARSQGTLGCDTVPFSVALVESPELRLTEDRFARVDELPISSQQVGKSCIVLRFVRGSFDPKSKVTVGAAFLAQVRSPHQPTLVSAA